MSTGRKLILFLVAIGIYTWFAAKFAGETAQSLVESASALLGTVTLGGLLVFRMNSSYDRWWEGRKLWGQLVNKTRNLAIKTSVFVADSIDKKSEMALELETFPFLLKDHLRALAMPSAISQESQPPSPAHQPVACAQRIYRIISNWRKETAIDGFQQMQLDTEASALMDICGACERIKLTPVVRSYRDIFRAGITLNILGLPWFLAPEFRQWCVPVVEVASFFLVGLELIAEDIEQPFNLGGEGLLLESICESIKRSVRQILGSTQ